MKRLPIHATAVLLLACGAAHAADGDADVARRRATVVQVGDSAALGALRDDDCRSGADLPATQRYAAVRYFSGRHAHLRVVPIADDLALQEGDQVSLKTRGCSDALTR